MPTPIRDCCARQEPHRTTRQPAVEPSAEPAIRTKERENLTPCATRGKNNVSKQRASSVSRVACQHGACSHRADARLVDQTGLNHSVKRRKVPGASAPTRRP